MQVWDAKNKEYIFQDKYYGRELRVGKDFQMALTGYITSTSGGDSQVLTHHIPTILSKIRQLGTLSPLLLRLSPTSLKLQSNVCVAEAIVQTIPQYRLYATSLLFLYDGATQDESIP